MEHLPTKKMPSLSEDNEDVASCLLALGKSRVPETEPNEHAETDRREVSKPPMNTELLNSKINSKVVSRPAQIISDDDQPDSRSQHKSLPLPETLMALLIDPVYQDMLTFLPDDNTFAILRPKVFASLLLPRFFSMSKLSSFVNKLEQWGFKKVNDGPKIGFQRFRHPLFRKDQWELCRKIKLQSRPRAKKSRKSSPPPQSLKPNYYSNLIEDIISQDSKVEEEPEQSTEDRQLALQAQLRALQQEESQLTAKKSQLSRERRLSLQTSQLSSTGDVIEATKDIVGAAIDCLLVDEDHTRSLLARHSLSFQQPRNSIFPQGLLAPEHFSKHSQYLPLPDTLHQHLGFSDELSQLEQVDSQLSLLAMKKQLQISELDAILRYSIPNFR